MRRQALIAVGTGLLVLAGCAGSDASTATQVETVGSAVTTAAAAPGDTAAPEAEATEPTPDAETTGTDAAQEGGGSVDPATVSGEVCSTDGSPTPVDPLDGDLPDVPIDAAFANSPLPSVTLRRINCDPGFVNLKNEAPGNQPVLYWFWAPF